MANQSDHEFDPDLYDLVASHADAGSSGFEQDEDDEFGRADSDAWRGEPFIYVDRDGRAERIEIETPEHAEPDRDPGSFEDVRDLNDIRPAYDLGGVTESGEDVVGQYLSVVEEWHRGDPEEDASTWTADRAVAVDDLRNLRLRLADEISRRGLLGDSRLMDPSTPEVKEHLKADLVYLRRPGEASETYDDFIAKRRELRHMLFGDAEFQVGTRIYTEGTATLQHAIASKANINLQYDLMDVRREAALEHFDDPRFIAEVGTHEGNFLDEMLIDFDRRDLLLERDAGRAAAMAEILDEKISTRPRGEAVGDKALAFQEWRELGRNMRHNQRAIVEFANLQMDSTAEGPNGVAFELGMAAFDNKRYHSGLWREWGKRFSDRDAAIVGGNTVNTFLAAMKAFDREFDRGEDGVADSFAMMERSAEVILRSDTLLRKFSEVASPDEHQALFAFHPDRVRERMDAIPERFEQAVLDRLGARPEDGLLGERRGIAVALDGKAVSEYSLDLDDERRPFHAVRQEDGTLRVSATEEDAKNGRYMELRIGDRQFGREGESYNLMPDGDEGTILLSRGRGGQVAAWSTREPVRDYTVVEEGMATPFYALPHFEKNARMFAVLQEDGSYHVSLRPEDAEKGKFVEIRPVDSVDAPPLLKPGQAAGFIYLSETDTGEIRASRKPLQAREHVALIKGEGTKEAYKLDLAQAGEKAAYEVADGGFLRIANSETDLKEGRFVELRVAGISVPPIGTTVGKDGMDAGEAAREHMISVLDRHGWKSLSLAVETTKTGEQVIRAKLPFSEDLGERMIRDGYALPTRDEEGAIRRERLTKQASAHRRGLWADEFPMEDDSWRTDSRVPGLTREHKRERLAALVQENTAGSPAAVRRHVMDRASRIFALPLQEWVEDGRIDRELMRVAQTDPRRLKQMYDGNMELLQHMRARKDDLTHAEKVLHDKLSIGRRALAGALVETGHLTPEQSRKDGHPLLSRNSARLNLEKLRPVMEKAEEFAQGTKQAVVTGGRGAGKFTKTMVDAALDTHVME